MDYLKKIHYKVFALKIKKETGKFPTSNQWVLKNNYPCTTREILRLFNSYNEFRTYCGEKHIKRTEDLSVEWLKSNCTVDNNDCWNWDKAKLENGYGIITYKSISHLVHRLSYKLRYSIEIPENLIVRHKCDNKGCCNPNHLELGTYSDNSLDNLQRNKSFKIVTNNKLGNKVKEFRTVTERIDYYLSNTKALNDSGCLVSLLLKPHHTGYYSIGFSNKRYQLHRLVLANKLNKEYQEIDIARHICNNKACINPNHLEEGSKKDNSLDSKTYNKSYKLSAEKVLNIRNCNLSPQQIDVFYSKKYGVTKETIANVRLCKTWKDIKPDVN